MRAPSAALVLLAVFLASPRLNAASADRGWSHVRELPSGTEITLTLAGALPAARYVISADELGLVVLNLDSPELSADAKSTLLEIADSHPDYFASALSGHTFEDGPLRIEANSVFVANRKVAPLEQIAQTIPRPSVRRIEQSGTRGPHDAAVGFVIAAATAIVGVTLNNESQWQASSIVIAGASTYGVIGAVIGAVHGGKKQTVTVIYEAPKP